jgi:integrase
MSDPIKAGTRPDGSSMYWFRVDAGRNTAGKRVQVYRSFDTKKDAKAEYARIVREVHEHRFAAPDKITVSGYLNRWEPAHGRDLEDGSRAVIRHALRPVRERLGERRLQSVTRTDVDQLVDWMLTFGRKRGGQPGTGLSPRSVQLTLVAFQRACDDAIEDRIITINPCRRVKRPRQVKPVHDLWTDEETARFEAAAGADRLGAIITLQCLGLRPEEVCGLRWRRDVNLAGRTLKIQLARTLVDGHAVEKPPKTSAGARVLPLDDALVTQLRAFKAQQAREKLAAGDAYDGTGDYVLCDELGAPLAPDKLRRAWYRMMRQAGVRKIKPYTASRHAAGSYLDLAGVSPAVIAKWLGHTDPSFTMKTYVHARPEDLAAARDALAARKTARE